MRTLIIAFVANTVMILNYAAASSNLFEIFSTADFSSSSIEALSTTIKDNAALKSFIFGLISRSQAGKFEPKQQAVSELSDMNVMDDCNITSLNNDTQLQIICRLDYTGRGRPTQIVAIFKEKNIIKYTVINSGEGSLGIGELKNVIKDVDGDGTSEIVIEDRKFIDEFGRNFPSTSPAPTIINIYKFINGDLIESNSKYKKFFREVVLPPLLARSNALRRPDSNIGSDSYSTDVEATRRSIEAVQRVLSSP